MRALFALFSLLATVPNCLALSCKSEPAVVVGACDHDGCRLTFAVEFRYTGDICETVPAGITADLPLAEKEILAHAAATRPGAEGIFVFHLTQSAWMSKRCAGESPAQDCYQPEKTEWTSGSLEQERRRWERRILWAEWKWWGYLGTWVLVGEGLSQLLHRARLRRGWKLALFAGPLLFCALTAFGYFRLYNRPWTDVGWYGIASLTSLFYLGRFARLAWKTWQAHA